MLNQPTLTVESLQSRIDGLWQALEAVTDPRNARGLRYRLPLLLALAVLAVAERRKSWTTQQTTAFIQRLVALTNDDLKKTFADTVTAWQKPM
ncbi:hypothetical protein [Saccharopolyspora hattusasensis]|uniref:hypothetical protein n=1 Tax=Saccharopolyspora hattusasensis TaxID=1128679 RepID=UPI003D984429